MQYALKSPPHAGDRVYQSSLLKLDEQLPNQTNYPHRASEAALGAKDIFRDYAQEPEQKNLWWYEPCRLAPSNQHEGLRGLKPNAQMEPRLRHFALKQQAAKEIQGWVNLQKRNQR